MEESSDRLETVSKKVYAYAERVNGESKSRRVYWGILNGLVYTDESGFQWRTLSYLLLLSSHGSMRNSMDRYIVYSSGLTRKSQSAVGTGGYVMYQVYSCAFVSDEAALKHQVPTEAELSGGDRLRLPRSSRIRHPVDI
jgi:hypothetical protein